MACRWGVGALGAIECGRGGRFAQLTGMICMPLFMSTGLLTQYYAGREIIRKIDAEVPAVEDDRPGELSHWTHLPIVTSSRWAKSRRVMA